MMIPSFPRCFDSQQSFDDWKNFNHFAQDTKAVVCDDCTVRYRSQMVSDHRCDPIQAKWAGRKLDITIMDRFEYEHLLTGKTFYEEGDSNGSEEVLPG